jgi:hypothetical protein
VTTSESSSARPTAAQLRAKIAKLEAENAQLSAQLGSDVAKTPPPTLRRWRTVVSVMLIVLASILVPLASVAGWSRVLLEDTDAFVATYAPLAKDPAIQTYVTDQIVQVIDQRIDIDALVNEVADGLAANMDRDDAKIALELLKQPAAEGIRSTIRSATEQVITSDAFAQAWAQSLRISHSQAIAALSGDPTSAVSIHDDELGIQLAPLIAQVKTALLEQGFTMADQIPAIDKTIVIARSDSLVTLQIIYRVAVIVGTWLGLVAVALLALGVAVANRRTTAALGACIGVAIGASTALGAVAIGRVLAEVGSSATDIPTDVLTRLYDTAISTMSDLASASLLLAVVVGCVAWLSSQYAPAQRLRAGYTGLVGDLRERAEGRGLSTGKLGTWLYRFRVPVRAAIGVLAAVALILTRPLTLSDILTTTVVAVLALFALSLLMRPTVAGAGEVPAEG